MKITDLIPTADMSEFHTRLIEAPVERVWQSFVTLPADELSLTRTLMWIRTLPLRASRPNDSTPSRATFLESAPVPLLEMRPQKYALAGGIGQPWAGSATPPAVSTSRDIAAFSEPGWVKIAAEFTVHPVGSRTLLTTETRVSATDTLARRRMRAYWLLIRPFSGLIRREVLASVDRIAVGMTQTEGTHQ